MSHASNAALLATIALFSTSAAQAQNSSHKDALWRAQVAASPAPVVRVTTRTPAKLAHRHALWREQLTPSARQPDAGVHLSTTHLAGRSHANALWRELHQPARPTGVSASVAGLAKAKTASSMR